MELGRPVGVFRSSVLPMVALTLKVAAAGGLFVALINTLFGLPALEPAWTLAKGIGVVVALLCSGAWIYSRVQIFEQGLRGYDFIGVYHEVPWSSIRSTRGASVAGLRYIVVSSAVPTVELWVPVFLANKSDFCAALRRHAGPSHPLTQAVLRHA